MMVDSPEGFRMASTLFNNHQAETGHFPPIPFKQIWDATFEKGLDGKPPST
jgi:hypothetical protein